MKVDIMRPSVGGFTCPIVLRAGTCSMAGHSGRWGGGLRSSYFSRVTKVTYTSSNSCLSTEIRDTKMDLRRKNMPEKNAPATPTRSQPETRHSDDVNDEKLTKLLAFLSSLQRTPPGAAEVERRTQLFGECRRSENETSAQYYARLRHWLDRDLPQVHSSRVARRQSADD